jgi:hypothetical protein
VSVCQEKVTVTRLGPFVLLTYCICIEITLNTFFLSANCLNLFMVNVKKPKIKFT